MLSRPMLGYVFLAAMRDRFFLAFPIIVVVSLSLSTFLGSAAVTEARDFVFVYAASGLRLAAVISLTLFICFYVRRSFDMHDIEFLLGRPLKREKLILSWGISFALLALAVAAIVMVGIVVVSPDIPRTIGGMGLWAASLVAELMIVALAAFFFAMVIPSATGAALAVFGFYMLARLIGDILGIVNANTKGILDDIMKVVALVVPRFDLMGQTSWLVYGPAKGDPGYGFLAGQAAVYCGLLLTATLTDFRRRQF